MARGEFAAKVKGFATLTKRNMRYVAAHSIQDVVEAAQTPQPSVKQTGGSFEEGKIPVDDADLINSLVAHIEGGASSEGATGYTVVIAGMEIGDSLKFEWTAAHAMRIEAGFTGTDALGRTYHQEGRHFVGANAARFQEFVEARVREVKT